MINLTIKRKKFEIVEIANVITQLFEKVKTQLSADDYLHFYNVRNLCKKLIDKTFSFYANRSGSATIKINVNEFESLLRFSELSKGIILFDPYYSSILANLINELDRQRIQLSHPSNFALPE